MAKWIDEQGGTVASDDGRLALSVPAGAWTGPSAVTIERGSFPPDLASRPLRAFRLRRLDARGQEAAGAFAHSVTLTLHLTPSDLVGMIDPQVRLSWYDPQARRWTEVPTQYDRATMVLTAALPHFSDYVADAVDGTANLPSVDGLTADLCLGAAAVSIPLKVPPGPHGFQPALTLSYSSAGPNGAISEFYDSYGAAQASWVGLGWNLNPGYVMIQGFGNWSFRGFLVLGGDSYDLIPIGTDANNNTNFRTQVETFDWIKMVNEGNYLFFLVRAKDGTEYRFGYEPQHGGPDNPTNFYDATGSRADSYWVDASDNGNWLPVTFYLDQVTDTHGNRITYTYSADLAQVNMHNGEVDYDRWVYLAGAQYNSADGGGPQRSLTFHTRPRNDKPNFPNKQYQNFLLDSIDEFVSGQLVRKYVFGYADQTYGAYPQDTRPGDLLLTSLTECDGTATSGVCNGAVSGNTLPPWTFQYTIYNGWVGDPSTNRVCPLPLLTLASNGNGGRVAYQYTGNAYKDFLGGSQSTQWWSVSQKTVADGQGNSYVSTYQHRAGSQAGSIAGWTNKFSTDTNHPIWRGFNETAVVDQASGNVTESRFYRGLSGSTNYNVSRSDGTTFGDSECLKGKCYEVRVFADTNTWNNFDGTDALSREWNVWAIDSATNYPRGYPSGFDPSQDKADWTVYVPLQSEHWKWRGSNDYLWEKLIYDPAYQNGKQYGNLTDTFQYDRRTDQFARHVKRWYYPGTDTDAFSYPANVASDHYIADRLAAENLYKYDGSYDGALEQATWYCYDGSYNFTTPIGSTQANGDASWRGRLTAVRKWLTTSQQFLDTVYDYDTYGNRTTETRYNSWGTSAALATGDPRTTTTAYDPTYHTFVTSIANPKSQTTTYNYEPKFGKLVGKTDPNSATTVYGYDGFGRLVAFWAPTEDSAKPGTATVRISYQNAVLDPTTLLIKQPYRIQHTTRKDAGGTAFARYQSSWRFYDGLGRLIQTQEDFSRPGMVIHAQDLNELSAASGAGFTVSAGTSLIKATDFTTVRTKIGTLWGSAHLGSVPSWTSGVTPSGPPSATPIYASDLVDLRNWLNLYQDATNTTRTAWTNGAGSVLVVNKFYDTRGCLANESVPHTLNLTVPGRFAGSDVDWSVGAHPTTTYTYDALKRPKTKVQPDGQATFHCDYAGFQTTTTDENGHQKTSTTDALGRTVQVQEKVNGNWSTTGYTYDLADRLIQVTDALGNQTTIGYDSLGRKIAMSDPDLGANWSYVYGDSPTLHNPIWLVASQTDPKNQTISYQYDRLDRLTNKTGSNLAVTYSYDDQSGGNCGVGRKTSLQDGAGSASYVYDKRGRLTSLSRTINLQTYQLTTSYDAQDRPLEISFPNGDVLTYSYGDHGKATFLVLNDSVPLVSNATYNALKKVTTLPLGNGLPTNWKYFGIDQQATVPNRWYGLPYRVRTGPLQNQVFDPASGYDLVGNPTTLSYIDHANETLSFAYNELDQLVSTSGAVSESYGTYLQGSADLGNLLSSREGTYSYPSAGQPRPHAPTAVGSASYQYDLNGNRQSDPTFGYTFDVENHLTKVTQGGTVVLRNTFDGDGNRLVRIVSGTKTHYVGDWFEFNPDTGLATVYYPFNGQAVAMKQGETLYYLHRDQVGSVVAVSDDSGNEVGTARYWPFGGARQTTGVLPTDRLFTGQIRDLGDDRFYFFKARYYDATIGKFVQPDTIVPDAMNPQALNRYAYGLNNPLRLNDPTGHIYDDPSDGGYGKGTYQNLTNISDPTLQAAARDLWEHGGVEGRQIVEYLRAHESSVSVIAQSGLSGATFNNSIHSVIWVGSEGPLAQVAGVLAHETTHLQQGHTVVTQADEIQAYQVQGRILSNLGVTGAANPWGTLTAQLGTASNLETQARLYGQSQQYRNWPVSRPTDLPHRALAGAIEYGTVGLEMLSQASQALSVQASKFPSAMQPVVSRTIAPFTPWGN